MDTQIKNEQKKWEIAITINDRSLSDAELIQRFCDIVGPAMNSSRCCYNRVNSRMVITEVEWIAEGVRSTLGEKTSARVVRALLNGDIQELNGKTAKEMLPRHLKVLGEPVISILEGMQQLVAIIAAPIRINGELAAVISFDICTERAHLANWPREKLDFASVLCKMLETELQRRTG